MKNQISRLLIVGGFVVCFVAGAAFHSIPGATSATVAADSQQADGTSDGVTSPTNKFTTP